MSDRILRFDSLQPSSSPTVTPVPDPLLADAKPATPAVYNTRLRIALRHAPPCEVASRWSALLETPATARALPNKAPMCQPPVGEIQAFREIEHAN